MVTLCHFDVPEALIRKYGAWADRRLIALYEKYAATMFDRYRNLVKYWMTFNEINMITHIPYLGGGLLVDKDDRSSTRSCTMPRITSWWQVPARCGSVKKSTRISELDA